MSNQSNNTAILGKKLGKGKFEVYQIKLLPQNNECALKVFPLDDVSMDTFRREDRILSKLTHHNIVKYIPNTYLSDAEFAQAFIITEYAPYGTFFDLVMNKGLVQEKIMRTYFHQLIEGLEYLHSNGIAHLDLKLENLLLGNDFLLKIADFDQSQSITEEKLLYLGTPCYRAPEVLQNKCKKFFAADIFSAGVLLFIFRAGAFPFVEYQDGTCTKMMHYDLFKEDKEAFWKTKLNGGKDTFSEDFKELVEGMLREDPSKRFNIKQIKQSRWYNGAVFTQEELKKSMERVWERISYRKYVKKSGENFI